MPYARPHSRVPLTATAPINHREPFSQSGHVGIAIKQKNSNLMDGHDGSAVIATSEVFTGIVSGTVEVEDDTYSKGDLLMVNAAGELSDDDTFNSVQQVVVVADSGTFTLTFSGQTTGNIAYNADAATVLAALEALSNIDPGDIAVTGVAKDWTVKFFDESAATMTGDATNLVGTPKSVTITDLGSDGKPFGRVIRTEASEGVRSGYVIVDLDDKGEDTTA